MMVGVLKEKRSSKVSKRDSTLREESSLTMFDDPQILRQDSSKKDASRTELTLLIPNDQAIPHDSSILNCHESEIINLSVDEVVPHNIESNRKQFIREQAIAIS